MYGHFDESPGCLVSSNRRDQAKISSFLQGSEKWRYVNQNQYITHVMLVLINVYQGVGLWTDSSWWRENRL